MPNNDKRNDSAGVVGDVIKLVAQLMQTFRDEQLLQREILLRNVPQRSGKTDQLDAQGLRQAQQQAQIDRLERGQQAIAVRVGTLDTRTSEILRMVTPWYVRLALVWKLWRAGRQ